MGEKTCAVVGLGKLGAPLAACMAARGFRVAGVDTSPEVVRLVNEGKPPVYEPGLEEAMRASRARIRATGDYGEAVREAFMSFIVVPTPSGPDGTFSLEYVLPACEKIGAALKGRRDFHVVVLTSTVLPGATEGEVLPVLEKYSGGRCGRDFGLCYNPEFIALGTVMRDMLNPDFVLIGEWDVRSGDQLASFYGQFLENRAPILRMSSVNAELTKLAVNTYVTTKISYANMLAEICERLPGADVGVVTRALGMDSRIGPKYLKGALGYGGPCFPRDNRAFAAMTRRLGGEAFLAEATDAVNRRQVERLLAKVRLSSARGGRIAILGLAYKPQTAVVEQSQGLELARLLLEEGREVVVYDPLAMDNARKVLGARAQYAGSVRECVAQASCAVLTIPCEEFRSLAPEDFLRPNGQAALIDCWRILDPAPFKGKVRYETLGRGGDWKKAGEGTA